MNVVVAGGHGQVARRLLSLLVEGGHVGRGLIRNPEHAADLEAIGAHPVVLDLEHDDVAADVLAGADAIVFAAGAGAGSGAARKRSMDLGGALKLIDAARANDVRRYVMVSSMGAGDPPGGSEGMAPYLQAKAEADRALAASGLDYTVVRPGRLTNDPGTGRVSTAAALARRGEIPRDDVAATLLAVLSAGNTIGKTFELLGGDTPIEAAVAAL